MTSSPQAQPSEVSGVENDDWVRVVGWVGWVREGWVGSWVCVGGLTLTTTTNTNTNTRTITLEAHQIVKNNGGKVTGIVIALDRMEKRGENDELSAVGAVGRDLSLPVIDIVDLRTLVGFLENEPNFAQHLNSVKEYRSNYGV